MLLLAYPTMKKLTWFLACLLAVILHSCSDEPETAQTSSPTLRDTTKVNVPMDRDDAQFAERAAISNLTEIEMGQMAMKKGVDKRIKNFGMLVMKDQAKADAKLQLIAKSKKITLPKTVDAAEKKTLDSLGALSGRAFDRAYVSAMMNDHISSIKLMQTASNELMDADLRAYAAKVLLTDKRHLDAATGIKGWMKR